MFIAAMVFVDVLVVAAVVDFLGCIGCKHAIRHACVCDVCSREKEIYVDPSSPRRRTLGFLYVAEEVKS